MIYFQTILRGIGQVMLQNNIYSGLLFLVGIAYNSWILAIAALLGTVLSTLIAHLLKYDKEDIKNGLYGFNGALVGIVIWFFFGESWISAVALVIGALLSTPVSKALQKILPPYTAPFVVVSWLMIVLLLFVFKLVLPIPTEPVIVAVDFMSASANGFGQIMFQENIITGVFFILGILVNSRISALYAIYASVLGVIAALMLSVSEISINSGLMGYNAILCAIALMDHKKNRFLWISLAVVVSVLLNIGMAKVGIITLTAPFVITTWIFLKLQKLGVQTKTL